MINFDKNATTGTNREVWDIMRKYAVEQYGNPSAIYPFAEKSRKIISDAKEILAYIIHCRPEEIYFVPSGSAADNWVLNSIGAKSSAIVTSRIEHHAITNTLLNANVNQLVISCPVDHNGEIDYETLEHEIKEDRFVSIMYVNNEIGVIQDISKIGHICRQKEVPFHTDAVQAFGKLPINVDSECIDFLSATGHKFHGPQGIGFMYIREKYREQMKPLFYGGSQQRGLIAGTENISGIAGLAYAAEKAYGDLEKHNKQIHEIHWALKSKLKIAFPDITFNGGKASHLESCISVCFANYHVQGEQLLAFLAENDICASSGSACNSQSGEVSHVLKAIGLSDEEANATLRFSFDADNTVDEVDEIIRVLTEGMRIISS